MYHLHNIFITRTFVFDQVLAHEEWSGSLLYECAYWKVISFFLRSYNFWALFQQWSCMILILVHGLIYHSCTNTHMHMLTLTHTHTLTSLISFLVGIWGLIRQKQLGTLLLWKKKTFLDRFIPHKIKIIKLSRSIPLRPKWLLW